MVNFRVRLYDSSQSGARFGRFGHLIVSTIVARLCFVPLFLRLILLLYRRRNSRDRFVVNHRVFTVPVRVFRVFHVENLHFLFLLLLWGRCLSRRWRQADIRLFNDDFNDRLRFFDVHRFLHHLDERFMGNVDGIAASSAIYTIAMVLDGICIRGQSVSIE